MFLTKRDQLYGFLSKIVDFRAILRKKTNSLLSYGLCYKNAEKKLVQFSLFLFFGQFSVSNRPQVKQASTPNKNGRCTGVYYIV